MVGRRAWVSLLLCALFAGTLACTASEKEDQLDGHGRLEVVVGGLPADVEGQVRVTGKGRTWQLAASKRIDVEPGTYTVTIRPVRAGESTRHGAYDARRVKVASGQAVNVDARYRIKVPDTTKVVQDDSRPPIRSVTPDRVVLEPGEYADRLRPGDVIFAGEGPKTPDALCRRVLSISRASGQVVASTKPAQVTEAFPDGVLQFEQPAIESPLADAPSFGFDHTLKVSGNLEFRVFGKGKAAIEWDADSSIAWSEGGDPTVPPKVEVALANRISYDTEFGYEIPYELDGLIRGSDDIPLRTSTKALNFLCGKDLKLTILKKAMPLECEVAGVAAMKAKVTGKVKHTYRAAGVLDQEGQKVFGPTGKATGEPPRYHLAKQGSGSIDKIGPSIVAAGEVGCSVGLLVKFAGRHPNPVLGLLASIGLQQKVTFGFDYATVEVSVAKKPEVQALAGVKLQADLQLDLELVGQDTGNLTFLSYQEPLSEWAGPVSEDEVDTTKPLYTVDQVRRAVPDDDSELAPGFDFLVGDPVFGCPHISAYCGFDDMSSKAAYVYADRLSPSASFAFVPVVYDNAAAAREAAERLKRELEPFDGEFQVEGVPEAATRVGVLLSVRMDGSGDLSSGRELLNLDGQRWAGGGLLQMRYREVPNHAQAFQIAMGRPPGKKLEAWFVQASHNLVVKARVSGIVEADWQEREILQGLTVPLLEFVGDLGTPEG